MGVIENYKTINTETAIKDKNSIFNYYRKLIKLRKEHMNLYAYKRKYKNQELLVIQIHRIGIITFFEHILSI